MWPFSSSIFLLSPFTLPVQGAALGCRQKHCFCPLFLSQSGHAKTLSCPPQLEKDQGSHSHSFSLTAPRRGAATDGDLDNIDGEGEVYFL